jgi:hypothetical protein
MATATTREKRTRVLGLDLTDADIEQLQSGKSLSLENRSLGEMGRFLQELHKKLVAAGKNMNWGDVVSYSGKGKCPGIELVAINKDCSLYWRPLMKFEECCRK